MKIGFIGQGFIGKNLADWIEGNTHFEVVRYALEPEYIKNKDLIKDCGFVFIAVPTPSTPDGFDLSIVRKSLELVGPGNVAVIKSTIVPMSTKLLQHDFPDITVMHSPEFLRAEHAVEDTENPDRNIVGITNRNDPKLIATAKYILADIYPKVMPGKSYIMDSTAAEFVKYGANIFLTLKLLYANMLYDAMSAMGVENDCQVTLAAIAADKRIGRAHFIPVADDGKRGAGGFCFIKDLAAFSEWFARECTENPWVEIFEQLESYNVHLLEGTGKDLDLVAGVYGPAFNLIEEEAEKEELN